MAFLFPFLLMFCDEGWILGRSNPPAKDKLIFSFVHWSVKGQTSKIIIHVLHNYLLVMGRDKNLRELNMNVISRFTIYGNLEIHE